MKKLITQLSLALCLAFTNSAIYAASAVAEGYPTTQRTKLQINDGWRFHLGGADEKNYTTSLDDSKWESVTIPHTLKLTSIHLDGCLDDKSQPTFHREVGWYRRDITPSRSSKEVILEFEGVHQVSSLWVNGRKVGVHGVGGYTPFEFNITDYVKRGVKNQITILADNRVCEVTPPDPGIFDYVKFSGLYRDVYLTERAEMHITSNLEAIESGITITTPSVDYVNGNATIDIRTEVRNDSRKSKVATIIQRVVDADGNVVLKMEQSATIPAAGSHRFIQTGGVEDDVKFWSPDSPYLYKVNTLLIDGDGNSIDVRDNRLGLRKVEYNHERGFIINGVETEIIGFNRHQHFAYIGDAMPNSLHYRDMIQFKMYGFNTMRTAHYPQDDEIIRACDELGILVYEEAPTWVSISNKKEWFENFHAATRSMIRNHKNSPSIIIWGAGINHRGAVHDSQFIIKQEDPTRLTASQSSRWAGWQTSSWTDIFANMNYGPGIWDRNEPLLAMEGHYGADAVAAYKKDPMMPGIISWTAHAYYTFHDIGDWEDRTRSGAMDAFRYPKNIKLAWYPSELLTKPYLHVVEPWQRDMKQMTIFSNASTLEFYQDGKLTGRYTPSKDTKYNGLDAAPYIIKHVDYKSNKLTIKGYRQREVIFERDIYTPKTATQLRLSADQYGVDLTADGNDIVVVHAEVLDDNGTKIEDYEGEIAFKVEGDGSVVGDQTIGANPVNVKLGKGSALIRAGFSPSKIKVTATSKGLKASTIELESVAAERDMMVANSYEIKDRETMLVDLGGEGQLTQFGWTPWTTKDHESGEIAIVQNRLLDLVAGDTPSLTDIAEVTSESTDGAYKFSIKPASKSGVIRWLGEMNVIGKGGFVYGDGVLCIDKGGVNLTIEQLPIGKYRLISYHHAPRSNTDSMDPNLERLKSLKVPGLPYSQSIDVEVNGKRVLRNVAVTNGKERQYAPAGSAEVSFAVTSKDGGKVVINYHSTESRAGVWLNGFELVREL